MNHFGKIFLLSFLFLQVFSYLHLEEHGDGGKHEHNDECAVVFHLNSFSADDSIDFSIEHPELEKRIHELTAYESQISQLTSRTYLSRAPPKIS